MAVIAALPLMFVVWIVYNAVVLLGSVETLDAGLFTVNLMSGAAWTLHVRELLLILGLVALYVEIFKATRTSVSSVVNHTLSMGAFIAFLVEFLLYAGAGNSTFMLLGLMALMDVVAGFTVTIVAARRDFSVGEGGGF
jgi:hypothetical protein